MKNIYYYDTRIGLIGIAENGSAITNVFFGKDAESEELEVRESPLLRRAKKQLEEYISGERRVFDLPVETEGTEFEEAVWAALQAIPFGETRSYGQIAEQIGKPKACRAVGQASGRNSIPIFIPCHRVIGANGNLTGFAGGLDIKQKLLALEK